jgi:hypothetical protein
MAHGGIRPAAPWRRASALALVTGLLVAACSGSAATSGPGASAASTTSAAPPTAVPTKGPATQQLTIAGPAGAAGAVTNAGIRCNQPALSGGLLINVLGQPTDPNRSVYINVQAGNITVRYDSGSGSTYVERDFSGTGVTNFDAAKGATIDSPLTEVATTGAHGNLGVLTSIRGSIDCGNQMPGSSTLTFSGPTAKGALSGGLNPVNVECITDTYGRRVSVFGVAQVDSTPTFMVISISPGTFSVSASSSGVSVGFFRNSPTFVATLTATGAQVDGDAVEQNVPAGAKAHTIHVSGDATCGTTIGG